MGTIHALCYRELGRPTIAETKLSEWNSHYAQDYYMSLDAKGTIDEPTGEYLGIQRGDELLRQYQVLRGRMIPKESWKASIQIFAAKWEIWKEENGYVDFTDLLEMGLRDIDYAPGDPRVIMLDESQDCTPLQWALIRKWAQHCDAFLNVGDADQLLYRWMGASPEPMMVPLPDDHKLTLEHSYRVPRAVHSLSQKWIRQINNREDIIYLPRDADGEVARDNNVQWRYPAGLLSELETELSLGRTVMILASCSYMLTPTIKLLREKGYPFHNPYRRTRGDWNPLGGSRGVSMSDRLLAFLRPERSVWGDFSRMWTYHDLESFMAVLQSDGIFKRGAKTKVRSMDDDEKRDQVSLDWLLSDVFEEESLSHALDLELDWFKNNLLQSKRDRMEYPLAITQRHGGEILRERPRIIIGTIHAVKGGEASTVILFPDLSGAGFRQWRIPGEARDSVVRMFYVGMTRAKEKLVLCAPSGATAVRM